MAIKTQTFTAGDYAWHSWSNGYVISLTLREESTDIENNTSLVSYLFTISNTDNNRFTSRDYSWSIFIGGHTIQISNFDFSLASNNTTQTIASGQVTVLHNADGSLDMPYNVSIPNTQPWTQYGPPAMTIAGTWGLSGIPRWAALISAPNFTDEENPTISYANPAGTAASDLYGVLCVNDQDVAVRNLSPTGTSYTFVLTSHEKSALYAACPTSNTMPVTFCVQSSVGGEVKRDSKNVTMTIVNAKPVLNPTVTECNDAMFALTGDRYKLVRFHSDAAFTIGASAKKGASIRIQNVSNNGCNQATDGVFYGVESGIFTFSAHDTRMNEADIVTVTRDLVPYIPLTCDIEGGVIDTSGHASITVDGNCFSGSFGAVTNTLQLQYRWRLQGGGYSAWQNMPLDRFSSDSYTAVMKLDGFDYRSIYGFQIKAEDCVETVVTQEYIVTGLPVFDWGKESFHINVPVEIQGLPLHAPMEVGVEYQTLERYKGKPVYQTVVDFGQLPVTARKTVAHGIANMESLVAFGGVSYYNGVTYTLPVLDTVNTEECIGIDANTTVINITTAMPRHILTAEIWLKYTKTTD